MKCKDCPYWKGTKYSKWADCYRIGAFIIPFHRYINRFGFNWLPPIDPHDAKYYDEVPKIDKTIPLPDGVIIRVVREIDVWYDQEGNERIKNVKLPFFKTHKDFDCTQYMPT